jgi:gluconolactonase
MSKEGTIIECPVALLRVGLVDQESRVDPAAQIAVTEGPAADADGNIYFSDIMNSRVWKLSADGKLAIFREESGRTNGNTFDGQGRLVSCEGSELGPGGRRRIVRTDIRTGEVTVLTDRYEGKRYNSPNDVVVDGTGRIYFTDPSYTNRSSMEMEIEGVYRIDSSGQVTRVLEQPAIQRPNGLAITPDNRRLYLIDSNPNPGGNRKVWAFEITPDGSLTNQSLVFDFAPGRGGDGMRLDVSGNLWIAAGISRARSQGETTDCPPGIYVINPEGKLFGRIPIPEDLVTNLCFAGPDKKTLYVTAGKTLHKIRVNISGWSIYPALNR